jgi:hypothetical protein
MTEKYFFLSKNSFLEFLFFFKVKFYQNKFKNLYKKKKNFFFIQDDIFSGREKRFTEHKSQFLFEKIENFSLNSSEKIEKIFIEKIEKKKIIEAISDILLFELISKKLTLKYKSPFFLVPNKIDLKILRLCKKVHKFRYLKLSKLTIWYFHFLNFIKSLFFFLKTFFLPEKFLFYKKKTNFNNKFHLGLILNYSEKFLRYENSPIENLRDSLEFFSEEAIGDNNKKIVYIVNNKSLQQQRKWINSLKENKQNKNLIFLKDIRHNINFKEYLFNIYWKNFKLRFFLCSRIIRNSCIGREIFEKFEDKILWEIFFTKNSLKNSVNVMIPDNSIVNFIKFQNNCKTHFIYYSYHGQIIRKKIFNNYIDSLEFSFLDFDCLLSNLTSLEWFKNNSSNNIGDYQDIGVITSAIVKHHTEIDTKIERILKNHNLNKIISVFDHSCGQGGMISLNDKEKLIHQIIDLSNVYKSVLFIYKSKSKMDDFYNNLDKKNYFDINEKVIIQKNFIILDSDYSSYRALSFSDIVITYPQSSIVEESFGSKKKTIIYDISKNFNEKYKWYYNLKDVLVDNYTDLSKLIKINMEIDKDEYFEKLKKNEKIMRTFHNFDDNLVENLVKKII